jgi:hypothetical protein
MTSHTAIVRVAATGRPRRADHLSGVSQPQQYRDQQQGMHDQTPRASDWPRPGRTDLPHAGHGRDRSDHNVIIVSVECNLLPSSRIPK